MMQMLFWSDQFLHIYDARHTFCVCTVEDNKLSNQILQLKFDDEDLDVIRNPSLKSYFAEIQKQVLCKMNVRWKFF